MKSFLLPLGILLTSSISLAVTTTRNLVSKACIERNGIGTCFELWGSELNVRFVYGSREVSALATVGLQDHARNLNGRLKEVFEFKNRAFAVMNDEILAEFTIDPSVQRRLLRSEKIRIPWRLDRVGGFAGEIKVKQIERVQTLGGVVSDVILSFNGTEARLSELLARSPCIALGCLESR